MPASNILLLSQPEGHPEMVYETKLGWNTMMRRFDTTAGRRAFGTSSALAQAHLSKGMERLVQQGIYLPMTREMIQGEIVANSEISKIQNEDHKIAMLTLTPNSEFTYQRKEADVDDAKNNEPSYNYTDRILNTMKKRYSMYNQGRAADSANVGDMYKRMRDQAAAQNDMKKVLDKHNNAFGARGGGGEGPPGPPGPPGQPNPQGPSGGSRPSAPPLTPQSDGYFGMDDADDIVMYQPNSSFHRPPAVSSGAGNNFALMYPNLYNDRYNRVDSESDSGSYMSEHSVKRDGDNNPNYTDPNYKDPEHMSDISTASSESFHPIMSDSESSMSDESAVKPKPYGMFTDLFGLNRPTQPPVQVSSSTLQATGNMNDQRGQVGSVKNATGNTQFNNTQRGSLLLAQNSYFPTSQGSATPAEAQATATVTDHNNAQDMPTMGRNSFVPIDGKGNSSYRDVKMTNLKNDLKMVDATSVPAVPIVNAATTIENVPITEFLSIDPINVSTKTRSYHAAFIGDSDKASKLNDAERISLSTQIIRSVRGSYDNGTLTYGEYCRAMARYDLTQQHMTVKQSTQPKYFSEQTKHMKFKKI